MSRVQVITDSTAYIPKEYIKENEIEVVPLSVELCGEVQKEGFPGEFDDFFYKLENTKDYPKTSQPAVGEFIEAYERAFKRGDEIVAIIFSSKLSGAYNSACTAANMLNSDKITVIDTESAVGNLKVLVETAVDLSKQNASRQEIVEAIKNVRENMSINLTVESLEYLKRGGRLSNVEAVIGTLLNIKPIIGLIEGKLIATEKIRGKKKAINNMIDKVPDHVKKISIGHVQNIDEALELKSILETKFSNARITIDEIGPVIGAHLGPKAIGICSSW
ncbi:EDD domain protein, DegV family [Gottschalkia purinilytica]|uniref:EDD domain protein, DegV family n=1 Tax=Gottschalkia purinilytica TaxID=1503 RepID=A0A0L0WEU5_GOTPU|nr:DegV family protein [Gottschalkia purinilytica]KNF10003.1 EDD domain protein, DegV family [Gottschalkia purinilytica]